jgi:hypothetical protein
MVVFPTQDMVQDFAKSRFDPLIASNPEAIGRFVKTRGRGADTSSLKTINGANLYLHGATLNRKVNDGTDAKESAGLRSSPVDELILEEPDLMDPAVEGQAEGRLMHSAVHRKKKVSNPTAPDRGIADAFFRGDQQYWERQCECGTWVNALRLFMADPEKTVRIREDGTGYVACPKCGREVGPRRGPQSIQLPGRWVADCPENAKVCESRQYNQFMNVNIDPAETLRRFRDPPQGDLANVYRVWLGLPYVPKESQLTETDVFECCGHEGMADSSVGPCAMGVDKGDTLMHVVIGRRIGRERYELQKICQVPADGWKNTLHDLARKFNVRSAVVDIRPGATDGREFQKAEPYRVLLCEYTENPLTDNQVDEVKKVVKAYRTGLLDTTHNLFVDRNIVLPRRDAALNLFARQCCDPVKILETNKKSGVQVYRYISTRKGDHYRHALGYFYLAAQSVSVVQPGDCWNRQRRTTAITEYDRFSRF